MTQDSARQRTWHIHLGAHKTATTHIQSELAGRRDALLADGVFFLPLEQTRKLMAFQDIPSPFLLRLRRKLGLKNARAQAFDSQPFIRACTEHLQKQVDQLAGNAQRVVISEEDLIGSTDQVFTGGYFNGSNRLDLIRELAKTTPIHLFLAVRALDGFLPSAYAQALRSRPASYLDFQNKINQMVQNPPSWADLVARISARIPQAHLTVWDYSDYAANAMAIQSMITGCTLEGVTTHTRPERTRSPSAQAILMAEHVQESDVKLRQGIVNRIYAEHPASGPDSAFRPIEDKASAVLRATYRDDLNRIAAMQQVLLKQF